MDAGVAVSTEQGRGGGALSSSGIGGRGVWDCGATRRGECSG
jgi:hypothetical protein